MKRFEILLRANTAKDESYLLQTAAKILADLQSIHAQGRLTQTLPPWQLAIEGQAEELPYIREQICDIFDGRRGSVLIKKLP